MVIRRWRRLHDSLRLSNKPDAEWTKYRYHMTIAHFLGLMIWMLKRSRYSTARSVHGYLETSMAVVSSGCRLSHSLEFLMASEDVLGMLAQM